MTDQARIEALAREMIQRGEFNHLLKPGEGARIDREYQMIGVLDILLGIFLHLMEKEILCHILM